MGLLNHLIVLVLIAGGTSILFSLVPIPVYNPTTSAQNFSTSLPILVVFFLPFFWSVVIRLMGMTWWFPVLLDFISPVTRDVEQLFLYSLALVLCFTI